MSPSLLLITLSISLPILTISTRPAFSFGNISIGKTLRPGTANLSFNEFNKVIFSLWSLLISSFFTNWPRVLNSFTNFAVTLIFGLFFSPRNEVSEDSFNCVIFKMFDIDFIPRFLLIFWLASLTDNPINTLVIFVYFSFAQPTKFLNPPDTTSLNLETASEKNPSSISSIAAPTAWVGEPKLLNGSD